MNPDRRCGVLLHPTSLPGPHGAGDLGPAAYHFVDWLVAGAQRLWQVLPLGSTGPGNSPYMSPSALAGNPLLIDLGALHAEDWLHADEVAPLAGADPQRIDFAAVGEFRRARLERAAERFLAAGTAAAGWADFVAYCAAEADWLDDDALYMALRARHGADLRSWPAALRRREAAALAEARPALARPIDGWKFTQWCFDRQWRALRRYANQRGIAIVGDLPIFVADHGVEVWAHPELFDLAADGAPRVVAGVPPDYFSATGQYWGNPLYRWPAHAKENYRWWKARLRRVLSHCDRVRVDHFRGFAAYWEIPAGEKTALAGRWVAGPGEPFFTALQAEFDALPLLAEDLGIITADVRALRQALGLPGMRVLQFAFDGKPGNPYLPHNYQRDTAVYTGTHDNDTTCGWWATLNENSRRQVAAYLGRRPDEIDAEPHWHLIRAACASVAETCILPMQDVLGLGSAARLNRPGEASGCWAWRFTWEQVGPQPAERLRELVQRYGRLPAAAEEDGDLAEPGGTEKSAPVA